MSRAVVLKYVPYFHEEAPRALNSNLTMVKEGLRNRRLVQGGHFFQN